MRVMLRIMPLLLFCLLTACGPEKRPKDVLDKERFRKVLTELYVLEGEAEYRKANHAEKPEKVLSSGTGEILEEHELSREKFVRSYRYYMKHPKVMNSIHEEVLNELMRRKGQEEREKG